MNTTPHPYGERTIQLTIIISLLLHTSIALYLSTRNFDQKQINTLQNKEEILTNTLSPKTETEWVETKTRSSSGAPVFFRDDYQPTITTPLQPSENDAAPEQISHDNHEKNENPIELANQDQITKEAPALEKQIDIQESTTLTTKKPTTPTIKALPPRTPQRPAQKQLPSLAQLTQGMLNYMQESGKHSVSMLGKKSGAPTDEQLKYERYLERLNQCLHNSFVINSHNQPPYSLSDGSITVYLALNKDGSIYNLKLIKSSGNRPIDLYVMNILRDASSSFPPVPHYLPQNPFSIHYIIGINSTDRYR